jgi:hypothetical protein
MTPPRDITPEEAFAQAAEFEQKAQEKRSIARNILGARERARNERAAAYDQAQIDAFDWAEYEKRRSAAHERFVQALVDSPLGEAWVEWKLLDTFFTEDATRAGKTNPMPSRSRTTILDDLLHVFTGLELQSRSGELERRADERQRAIDGA